MASRPPGSDERSQLEALRRQEENRRLEALRQRSAVDRGGVLASRIPAKVSNLVTGVDRGRGNFPELGSLPLESGSGLQIAAGFVTTPNIDARKNIIKKTIPDASFRDDEFGNVIVKLPDGREAFLNAPGLSTQDFADLGAGILKFLPAARFAGGGKTVLSRITRGIFGSGATSASEDVAGNLQGGDLPGVGIDVPRAGVTAAFGGGAEAIAPGVIAVARSLGRVLRRSFGQMPERAILNGQLTPEGRRAVVQAGLDPDNVTPETAEAAVRLAKTNTDLPVQSRGAQAEAETTGIPLTRGEVTGDARQLARESELRARGDAAGDRLRSFEQRRKDRAREAIEEVQETFARQGGRQAARTEAEAAGQITPEIQQQARLLDDRIGEAFDQARASGSITLSKEGLSKFSQVGQILEERGIPIDKILTPATRRAIREIRGISRNDFDVKTLNALEITRRKLVNLQGATKNPTDRLGVTLLKRQFDETLDEAFDNTLFSGDKEALDALKNARNLRAEFGRRFQETTRRTRSGRVVRDPGERAVEAIVERNPTNEEVVNLLFGMGRLFDNTKSAAAVDAVRRAAGNSEVVDSALKQLAFRRLVRPALRDQGFNPKQFARSLNDVLERNNTVLRKIFSDEEIKKLREFRNVALNMSRGKTALNAQEFNEALIRTGGQIGTVIGLQAGGIGVGAVGGRVARGVLRPLSRSAARREAERAVSPALRLPGRPNDTTIATIIAAARQAEEADVGERSDLNVDLRRDLNPGNRNSNQQP